MQDLGNYDSSYFSDFSGNNTIPIIGKNRKYQSNQEKNRIPEILDMYEKFSCNENSTLYMYHTARKRRKCLTYEYSACTITLQAIVFRWRGTGFESELNIIFHTVVGPQLLDLVVPCSFCILLGPSRPFMVSPCSFSSFSFSRSRSVPEKSALGLTLTFDLNH